MALTASDVLHRELAIERIRLAHGINLVRFWGVSAFFVLFLVLGGLLRVPAWQGNLELFAIYWAILAGMFWASRRSDRVARWASLSFALVDVPIVFFLQWATFPTSPSASGVAGFTIGVYVLLVILAALSLERWNVLLTAAVSAVFEILLQHLAGVGVGAMVSTILVLGVAAIACSYAQSHLVTLLERVDRDVAEQRRVAAALREAEAVGRLASGAANELEDLTATVIAESELLYDQSTDEEARLRALAIVKAARLAAKLASQLLALSSRATLRLEPLNLVGVVKDLCTQIRTLVPPTVSVVDTVEPEAWPIRGDLAQIEVAILDLVANARDAMPDGGRLELEVANVVPDTGLIEAQLEAKRGSYVAITVRDTGHGMDPDVRARLFEPFFTTKADRGRMGLGLPSVHGIVRQHGGFIEVDSAPGAGTAVRMYFPVLESAG